VGKTRTILILLFMISMAIALGAQAPAARETRPLPPPLPVNPTLLHLDRASADLDLLIKAIERGDAPDVRTAVKNYTREVSRFHVELSRLRIGKKDLDLMNGILDRLDLQTAKLEAAVNKVQPSQQAALAEAVNHLKSAFQLVVQKMDKKNQKRVFSIRGPQPDQPGRPQKPQ